MTEPTQTGGSQSLISLGNEREVLDLVANSIMGLWDVVNNLTRLRPTQRERYRVTIFGSARVPEDHWVYAAVRDVAEERKDQIGRARPIARGAAIGSAGSKWLLSAIPRNRCW